MNNASTIEQELDKLESLRRYWTLLLDGIEPPSPVRLMLWQSLYPESVIQHGIKRASAKRFKTLSEGKPMSSDDAQRYASSVMRREHTERKARTAPIIAAQEGTIKREEKREE
jgi:hypothetical protein